MMVSLSKIGAASALFAVAYAGYEPAPGYDIPEGATLLPPSKYCADNSPIPWIPFTPEGEPPLALPESLGCEPAIVFCGLQVNPSQRVSWCNSSEGMPSSWGWSNNVDYATTTVNCAIGAKYTDCDLDNENGVDIGSVVVSENDQTFTVSVFPGYEISSYNIQTGPDLDTSVSADYTTYQTSGDAVADGESITLDGGETFSGSDWFVMHVMYCEVEAIPDEVPDEVPESQVFESSCSTLEFENQCDDSGDKETDCAYLYPGAEGSTRTCGANGVCICDDEDACGCSKAPPASCPAFDLDFNDAAKGEYVRDKWAMSHGVVITAVKDTDCAFDVGHTPWGAARVFDSAHPGNAQNGDPDLGSPNKFCRGAGADYDQGPGDGGYPGIGNGGKPKPLDKFDHSNCVPQGKSLIVQEWDNEHPDDTGCGGTITFEFYHTPAFIGEVGLLDVDDNESVYLTAILDDGTSIEMEVPGYGDNSMVRRPVNLDNVRKLVVYFTGSGTITYIKDTICPPEGGFPEPPAIECSEDFYQNECESDGDCISKYGDGTCNGVCFCANGPCGCDIPAPFETPEMLPEQQSAAAEDEKCDPAEAKAQCSDGIIELFWAKTSSATNWESDPGHGDCIKEDNDYRPAGFEDITSSISKVDGSSYFTDVGSNDLMSQKFEFLESMNDCFVIETAHKAANECFNGTSPVGCTKAEFTAQVGPHFDTAQEISHGEVIFGCCLVARRKLAEAGPASILEEKLGGQAMKRRRTRERKFPYW